MNIKKNILAPAVLTLGSLSVIAGVAAPVISSSPAMIAASPGAIGKMG